MSSPANTTVPTPDSDNDLIEIIPRSAVVPIEMSMHFCMRVNQIIGFLLLSKSREEIQQAHQQIESGKVPANSWVQHYETLLILSKEFENKSRALNLTKKVPSKEALALLGETE